MDLFIRQARAEDYDALCELYGQVDELHRDHVPGIFRKPDGPARERAYLLDVLADETAGLFVAEADGQLDGFIHVLVRDAPPSPIFVPRRYAVVDAIAVRKGAQRRSIGRALMERAHHWAAEKGATAVELNVHAFNQGALAFYEALGYTVASRRMRRALVPPQPDAPKSSTIR